MIPKDQYKLAFRTTVVTAVFALIVSVMLIADYVARTEEDPLTSPVYVQMREELRHDPTNEALQVSFRSLDAELRKEYFDQRTFTYWGGWLLLMSTCTAIGLGKWAAVLRRRMPDPRLTSAERRASADEVDSRTGRYAVAGFTGITVVVAVAFFATIKNRLPALPSKDARLVSSANRDELPVVPAAVGAPAEPGAAEDLAEKPAAKPEPGFPSEAEILENWPRFRGPHGLGIAPEQEVLTQFDVASGEGVVWQTDVPLPGNNSPIIWGDRIFLSGATAESRQVICFELKSGEMLWSREVPSTPASIAEVPRVMDATGFAAPTMATDGRHVFASFANGDIGAFDFEGELRWSKSLGLPSNSYGHASSLTTFENLLIVQFDQGQQSDNLSKLMGLDVQTGDVVWEAVREGVPNSWPTPIVVKVADQWQLIACASPHVISYSPRDGKEIWRADCLGGDVGPSPVYAEGIVVVANEVPGVTAIKADGRGDVTESHLLWDNYYGVPDLCSPLATEKMVLLLTSDGLLCAYDLLQGAEDPIWEQEFDASFSSSPTIIGNNLYLIGTEGNVFVLTATMEGCETIAENSLDEECVTSPAVKDGRIFIRTKTKLMCIGNGFE